MTGGEIAIKEVPLWYKTDSRPIIMTPQRGSGTGIIIEASVSTFSCFQGVCDNYSKTN